MSPTFNLEQHRWRENSYSYIFWVGEVSVVCGVRLWGFFFVFEECVELICQSYQKDCRECKLCSKQGGLQGRNGYGSRGMALSGRSSSYRRNVHTRYSIGSAQTEKYIRGSLYDRLYNSYKNRRGSMNWGVSLSERQVRTQVLYATFIVRLAMLLLFSHYLIAKTSSVAAKSVEALEISERLRGKARCFPGVIWYPHLGVANFVLRICYM